MRQCDIPDQPHFDGTFTAPTDPDLLHMEQACWLFCKMYADLKAQGFEFRQIEESDTAAFITAINAQSEEIIGDFEVIYE